MTNLSRLSNPEISTLATEISETGFVTLLLRFPWTKGPRLGPVPGQIYAGDYYLCLCTYSRLFGCCISFYFLFLFSIFYFHQAVSSHLHTNAVHGSRADEIGSEALNPAHFGSL